MEYIETLDELRQRAFARLGLMTEGSYQYFMGRAQRMMALQISDSYPRLIVALIYKDPALNLAGVRQMPYPILDDEWGHFVKKIEVCFEEPPEVFAVDGSVYTAAI